jgi:phosphoesterase RecJ-like protein
MQSTLFENAKSDNAEMLNKAVSILKDAESILILTHKSPDGDTLGSAFALCRALKNLGKQLSVVCSDSFPQKYDYLYKGLELTQFEPELIVACDIASVNLLGERLKPYENRIGLCIDHHPSNTKYADCTLIEPTAAATCEVMAQVIDLLGVEIDSDIANCLYTGLVTDTGCFRYSNTSPKTLRVAAHMIEKGASSAYINKLLFETKSRGRLEIERLVLETLEYHFDGRAALVVLTRSMNEKTGIGESDTEGIPSITACIEGVEVGITVKEKENDVYKLSLRTNGLLNASNICGRFGGGGHAAAAGCQIDGKIEDVKTAILGAVSDAFSDLDKSLSDKQKGALEI